MTRDLPPLNALRAFEAAARHSSYSSAALELNVVHTSVARHVRNLEDWFGVKLFTRAGRYVRLTEEGQHLHEDVARIFAEIGHATRSLKRKVDTKVRLSVEPIFMHQWLAKRVFAPEWRKKMQGFEIDIRSSFQVCNLAEGEADLAIRHMLHPPPESDAARIIAPQTHYPFVAPHVLQQGQFAMPLQALINQPLIYVCRTESWRSWFETAGLDFVAEDRLTQHEDPRVAILAARAGNGAVLLSDAILQDDVAEGALTRASDIGLPFGSFVLLTAEGASTRPAVLKARAFLSELLATFEGRPGARPASPSEPRTKAQPEQVS
jgi:LysR family glycine cleavage system transcriptional activator